MGCGGRLLGCLTLVVAALGAVFYVTFRKTTETVEVSGFEWRRDVDIEAWRTVREEAWEGSVPEGARVLASRRAVHHSQREQVATERVRTGTRDAGNGTLEDVFEDRPLYRERPVYATMCDYEIERWVPARTARASGQDQSPRWPEPGLAAGEREGSRLEGYTVLLKAGARSYRTDLPMERWARLRVGQILTATIRGSRTVEALD